MGVIPWKVIRISLRILFNHILLKTDQYFATQYGKFYSEKIQWIINTVNSDVSSKAGM